MLLPEHKALLGATVTGTLSKVTGIVAAIQYNLASAPVAYVQPPVKKDGTLPSGFLLDLHMGTYTRKVPAKKLPEVEETDIELGDKVEDVVTGFKGIVTGISYGYNGCCEILAVSRASDEHKTGKTILMNCKRLQVVESGAVKIQGAVELPTSNKGSREIGKLPARAC